MILHKLLIVMSLVFVLSNNKLYAFSKNTTNSQLKFLTTKEQKWVDDLQTPLTIGITQIPNQVLKSKKTYRGYSIDLFKNLESILGVKFKYVYYDTWKKLLQGAKNKEVDILFLAQKTEQRLKYFNFTDIVLLQHNKILASSKKYLQLDITDLYNKKVAVVQGSAIEQYIKMNYPKIITLHTTSEWDSLQKLLHKKVNYTVIEPVRASYYMGKHNIDNLYIAGDFPYDYKLRIATRRDLPILSIILNKGLDHISPAEKKALALKWGYEKEKFFDKKLLINIAIILGIVILFLFYLSILNSKLKKAQKSLNEINKTLEKRIHQEVEKNRQKDIVMLNQSRFVQMGQAINMIAHQWKQPLNSLSIIIQAHYLKCKKGDSSDEKLNDFKTQSLLQIKQMSNTIDDFRNFFKEQKEKTDFNFKDVLSTLTDMVKPILEKSHIELLLKLEDDITLRGYPNELVQAIINIIYNAKDALIANNKDKREIEIVLKKDADMVTLTIKDNAGGIPEDILKDIFEPYFSTKGKKGTGIGLSMAKIIIEQHMGGKITAYNKDDGAVFQIEFKTI